MLGLVFKYIKNKIHVVYLPLLYPLPTKLQIERGISLFYNENTVRKMPLAHAYKQNRWSYLKASSRSDKWVRIQLWSESVSDLTETVLRTRRDGGNIPTQGAPLISPILWAVCSQSQCWGQTLPSSTLLSFCMPKHLHWQTICSSRCILEFLE